MAVKFDANRDAVILSKQSKISQIIWQYMKKDLNEDSKKQVKNDFRCGDIIYYMFDELGNAIVLKESSEYVWVILEEAHFNIEQKESKFKKLRFMKNQDKKVYRFAIIIDKFIEYEDIEKIMK